MKRRILSFAGVTAISLIGSVAFADAELEAGVKCYQKKDLKGSLTHFQNVLKTTPNDYNALYYSALIYHRNGAAVQAKNAYAKLIRLYPNSDAAKNAAAALSYLDPKLLNSIQPQQPRPSASVVTVQQPQARPRGAEERSSELDILPEESQVFFEPRGNAMIIDAYVNNRPVKMVFDTGAEGIVFGKNHLSELGIAAPEGEATGLSFGVGDGGAQKSWATTATIKVGQIERRGFPIAVHEDMPTMPLLGQSFFKDFQYSIQRGQSGSGGGSIRFKKKSASGGISNDPQAIPFTRHGNEVVVAVQINGRPVNMFFDTGAEQCVFSADQIRQLGIEVPDDAQVGMSLGIAGSTRTRTFNVNRMRLGPIEKADVPISIVDGYQMPYPLLGQTFFGDLRCEFDNSAHVIRLRR